MAKRPRIGVVTSQASRLNGGVFEVVVTHCEMLRAASFEPIVFALADRYSEADRTRLGITEVVTTPVIGPAKIGYSPAMLPALMQADLDLIHLHGIWMYPSRAVANWAKRTGRPLIISPHGMLDPWIISRGKLKKAAARALCERASWHHATIFHGLTKAEAHDIKSSTGRDDIVVIANAAPPILTPQTTVRQPIVTYLGRIHPKKNLTSLLNGWRSAAGVLRSHGAELRVAGWGFDEHITEFKAQLAEQKDESIRFLGPVFGADKDKLLAESRFFALPSLSEGLPMVILEAWSAGTPTLMSQHCHLPEGFEAGCSFDCGTESTQIANILRQAFTISNSDWNRMSQASTKLIGDRFSTKIVAHQWLETYKAALGTKYYPPN